MAKDGSVRAAGPGNNGENGGKLGQTVLEQTGAERTEVEVSRPVCFGVPLGVWALGEREDEQLVVAALARGWGRTSVGFAGVTVAFGRRKRSRASRTSGWRSASCFCLTTCAEIRKTCLVSARIEIQTFLSTSKSPGEPSVSPRW